MFRDLENQTIPERIESLENELSYAKSVTSFYDEEDEKKQMEYINTLEVLISELRKMDFLTLTILE